MEDVLKRYEKPLLEKEPVVCMDEKTVVLHAEVRPPRPMQPGQVLRRDCEYVRRGTANAFSGVEPKAGRHFTKVTSNRSAPQFADYLVGIVAAYPDAGTIHLVMDNLSTHRRKAVVDTEKRSAACYGIGLRCITRPSTAVGSIKPRSRSVCSAVNAWDNAEFHR